MGQGDSARDFGTSESMKNAGILNVFPIFHTARLGQKIRRSPQSPLCGVALTRKACLGILCRSSERDEPLPTALRSAPALQAGLRDDDATLTEGKTAFSANQRDEVPDWHDVTVALRAQPGMMQQTCIAES